MFVEKEMKRKIMPRNFMKMEKNKNYQKTTKKKTKERRRAQEKGEGLR